MSAINPLDCPACGDELVWAKVPAVAADGTATTQTIAFDQSGEPHAGRCTDNPFTTSPRGMAMVLAREVQHDLEAAL